ncbi:MAG: hydrogenase nickel incorporation protein HypB [Desulfobacterales bacterium]|jgi:hydrogenase nickel incorporation protein HypB
MTINTRELKICRHHKDGPHSHHSHPHPRGGADVETRASGTREIKVVRRVLDANDIMAGQNRKMFAEKRVFVLNVMSSPGSGKTTTLIRTLSHLMPEIRCAVIVGDICSTYDADQLSVSGAPVIQINTDEFGGDCHLAAHVIAKAAADMDLDAADLLVVENVGNLVCPAEFDVGEDAKVVVLSVAEGEDKPIKYPLMFRQCDAALLNKIDLLPYLDYDPDLAVKNIRQVHPEMPVFPLSAKTGAGFEPWLGWLRGQIKNKLG